MNKGTIFTTTVDDVAYQYVNNSDITITLLMVFINFLVCQFMKVSLVTFKYTVDVNDVDQKFIIPSANADTSTLLVKVQNSTSDTTTETYALAGGYNNVTATSKVYFIQEGQDGKYEVYFGDGVNGKASDGNIVILEYIVTNITVSNGASSFTLSGNIGGFSDVTIATVSNSQGGAFVSQMLNKT